MAAGAGTETGSSRNGLTAAGDEMRPVRDNRAAVTGKLEIRPIGLKAANCYVEKYHRHHKKVAGHKFSICVCDGERIAGVAICGRPVSRYIDDGTILEINRVCTDGTKNACSMLYGACCRIAKDMGYRKIVTYILKSENGASLKASNFTCEGEAGGEIWTGKRERDNGVPREKKTRWSRVLNPDAKAAPEIYCDIGERDETQMNIFEYMNDSSIGGK